LLSTAQQQQEQALVGSIFCLVIVVEFVCPVTAVQLFPNEDTKDWIDQTCSFFSVIKQGQHLHPLE
jgi:hypothetical protein